MKGKPRPGQGQGFQPTATGDCEGARRRQPASKLQVDFRNATALPDGVCSLGGRCAIYWALKSPSIGRSDDLGKGSKGNRVRCKQAFDLQATILGSGLCGGRWRGSARPVEIEEAAK
jgi:hypothetical protein